VVVTVTVNDVPAATPVTVTRPVPLIDTMPDAVAVQNVTPNQMKAASWLLIWTMKPSAVAVAAPKAGVCAAPTLDVAVSLAVPPA
jgi:hypothetical protein